MEQFFMLDQDVTIITCSETQDNIQLIENIFSFYHYQFQHFDEVEDVIEFLSPNNCHALLLGLYQQAKEGKITGLQAIPIVRKIDPNLPIIAIAHSDSLDMERKARMAGVFYYLLQPVDVNEVKLSIQNAVTKHERQS